MNRRLLILISSIIVFAGILFAVYFFVFAPGASLTVGVPGNPFGSSTDRTGGDLPVPDGAPIQGAGRVVAPKLLRITEGPVAKGVAVLSLPEVIDESASTATTTVATVAAETEIRFVERQSGNIYTFRVHDRVLSRISNRTLPGVQEASWTNDGARAFVRYLTRAADGIEHVDTYSLPAEGGEGYFLEQDLEQVVVGSDNTVFSLLPTSTGSVGSLSAADGTNIRTLFTSVISRLRTEFSGENLIATTKASSGLDGYSFLVSRASGSLTRILGPMRGLATLPSPDGSHVLYSFSDRGKLATQVLNLTTRTATPLPLATLAEKCAWAPEGDALYCAVPTTITGNLPDNWYQGAQSFTDRIWYINLDTRLATLVVDPKQVGEVDIDAVALTLDSEADVLVFTNKRDGSLWVYDL
ncbi:hypothetical protein KJ819_00205 [Patescibacteria group bacterium]|nr:hypothetical protein [Patescibacteria group bacterium]MBU1500621.1 hypothetical protein [Patescibacteria group bacterium]MBU2080536.1 hypothetical protein [Patescibacteria group bacterium]MBU2123659.1 hypothetical protein [Patescibacteria group bacterium]MBU2194515.1 hypothetical protein [Patescibacteria group bacterium]